MRACGGGGVPRSGEWGPCDGTCDLLRIDEEDGFSPHERTKPRRWPTTSREEGPHPEPELFAFLTSRAEREKCLLLKHPGCGIC